MAGINREAIGKAFEAAIGGSVQREKNKNTFKIDGEEIYIARDENKIKNNIVNVKLIWIDESDGKIYGVDNINDVKEIKNIDKNSSKQLGTAKKTDNDYEFDEYTVNEILKWIGKAEIKSNPTPEEILTILEKSKQIILQGPPGTGKTRLAKLVAGKLIGLYKAETDNSKGNNTTEYQRDKACIEAVEKEMNGSEKRVKLIQFHPAYNYDDFVRGIDISVEGGTPKYEVVDKIFGEFAKKASENSGQKYVLIIDEINRAPLSSVLGELIYGLEKRNEGINTLSQNLLSVPDNLYIIGTMNTADKSLSPLDYAVRRRFSFVNIYSRAIEFSEGDGMKFEDKLYRKVMGLFKKDYLVAGMDPEDIKLGSSFFISKQEDKGMREYKLEYEIVPILKEYYKEGMFKKKVKLSTGDTLKDVFCTSKSLIDFLRQEG